MIQKKHIKKITTFLLLIVTVLTLVACSKKESVPYGSLSDDVDYITLGDISISEKEIYENLRRQSSQTLPELITKKLFAGYADKANTALTNDEDAQVAFDNIINTALFNTTDEETLKSLNELNREISVLKFVDSVYLRNGNIDRKALVDELQNKLSNTEDEDYASKYYEIEVLKEIYLIDIQKRLYAQEILAEEVLDEDSSAFVSDANVISYYNNNVKDRNDANVFYFHFLSLAEANAALRNLNLKTNSRGHWFEIPDVRLVSVVEGLTEEDQAYKTLDNLNLLDKANSVNADDATRTRITEIDYRNYYDAYNISESTDEKIPNLQLLNHFVNLYNEVNNVPLTLVTTNDSVIDAKIYIGDPSDEVLYETNKTYDELTEVSTSLRTFIYNTLTEEKPYSTLRTVGNFRYLAFKLDENYNSFNFVSEEEDEDGLAKWVTVEEVLDIVNDEDNDKRVDLLSALRNLDEEIVNSDDTINEDKLQEVLDANIQEWTKEVVDAKLTTSYINNKVNEIINEAKIEIFDNYVRTLYNHSATTKAKGSGKEGDVLLTFKGELNDEKVTFDIKVDEFYNHLESRVGVETSIDIMINKYLLDQYRNGTLFEDLELDEDSFRKEYRDFINGFSNDEYAQAGYPASLGREAFLLLLFGTTDIDEAIESAYIIPALREAYMEDYDAQLGNVNIFEQLEYFTHKQYDEFKGLNVGHLLVYFDFDGDDQPENPQDFFDTLDADQIDEIKEGIVDLYELIRLEVEKDGLSAEKLTALVDEYQSYARIDLGNYKPVKWERFRKLGLNLKYEALPNEISNSSNFITSGSTLDKVFYDRAMALHELIMEDIEADEEALVDGGLPFIDFGGSLNIIHQEQSILDLKDALDENGIMSSFGFHFIMVTNVSEKLDADYDADNDTNDDFTVKIDDVEHNAYNEDVKISKSQIEFYLKGSLLEDGVSLPSKVNQAFTKYFDPVFTLYTNQIMSIEILNALLVAEGVDFNGNEARFEIIREINQNQFHNYLLSVTEIDPNYEALYGDWFEKFGL